MRSDATPETAPMHAPPRPLVWFEKIFTVFTLVLFAEAFASHLLVSETGPLTTSELRYLWVPAYLFTGLLCLPHLRRLGRLSVDNWPIIGLVLLCAASTTWSIDGGVTARRAFALGATTLFGFYLALRFSAQERIRLVCWAFFIIAVGSIVFALFYPEYGIMSDVHAGAWSGAFQQKNKLGAMMVVGMAAFMTHAIVWRRFRMVNLAGTALCFAVMLLSTSITSLLAALAFMAVVVVIAAWFWRVALGALLTYVGAVVGVALAAALIVDTPAVLEMLGRDPTLTGRTDIWEAVFEQIAERPWLGWGYGAFWELPMGPAWYVRRAAEWEVTSAHNGWVEIWIGIGLVGLVLFALSFLVALFNAVRDVALGARDTGPWAVGFLVLFLIFSLSESAILQQNNVTWALYVMTVCSHLPRRHADAARPAQFGGMAEAAWERPAASGGIWHRAG